MQCLSCGAFLPDAAKFCAECGAAAPLACSACGHAMSARANFCPQCGASVADRQPPGDAAQSLLRIRKRATRRTPVSSVANSPCSSATWSVRRQCRPAWIRRTCGKSSVLTIDALPRPWERSMASSLATWATARWSISAIPMRMKTTRSVPYAQRWLESQRQEPAHTRRTPQRTNRDCNRTGHRG